MLSVLVGIWLKYPIKIVGDVPLTTVQQERASRQVGVWVMTMLDQADKFGHWADVKRREATMPVGGPFSCSDPDVIARTYSAIRKTGIDYILLDDTNTLFVDDGLIDKAVKAWFDYSDKQPIGERLQIAIAAGGELNQHSDPVSWSKAVDILFARYASRPSYLRVNNKPVLYWYIEKDVQSKWTDSRWTIRKTYHFFRTEDGFRNGGWGYGANDATRPEGLECASIQPGWDLSPPGFPRKGGELYCSRWSRAISSNPGSILLSDWNGWNEGTALSESASWHDNYGDPAPSWYIDLTHGFVQLFKGKLIDGFFYRLDGAPEVFRYSNQQFVYQGQYPHGKPVVIVPPGYVRGFPPIR